MIDHIFFPSTKFSVDIFYIIYICYITSFRHYAVVVVVEEVLVVVVVVGIDTPAKLLNRVGTEAESTGNNKGDICKQMNILLNNRFVGKSVLVLGCAYGFEVYWLRQLGILADGIDVSAFAISQADPAVAPYLQVQDARTYLPTLKRNEYDYILSWDFLCCMSDDDLLVGTFAGVPLIDEMNRVCRSEQVHMIWDANPTYYNHKTLTEWQALPFSVGTILVPNNDFNNYVTVIN